MKVKPSAKNPRIIIDEYGNEIFHFKGDYLQDLQWILDQINKAHVTYPPKYL